MPSAPGSERDRLYGRDPECTAIIRLLGEAQAGRSGLLVLRGDAGSGKTALLRYAQNEATGFRVASVAGVQSEMDLPYGGLHQLCAPLLDGLPRLPDPQRHALEVTFGMRDDPAPDRFLVGLAVLTLLADAADDQNLLCLFDDVQWLDRATVGVLTFAVRRLVAEPIAVVLAVRDEGDDLRELTDLPTRTLSPLSDDDARRVLLSTRTRLDEQVRDRILAEARGNPLALTELPRSVRSAELAGGFAVSDERRTFLPVERSILLRLQSLSEESQLLVLTAAAEPVGDVEVLVRAADALGVEVETLRPAQAQGLVEVGARVQFRHPLVRSAVYQAATAEARRRVHRALAMATDPETDADRRAWHRAHAAEEPDDDVAAELERSANRAKARGGVAAAAAFLERAATLTLDPVRRCHRALDAADMKVRAGAPDAGRTLLTMVGDGPDDELLQARSQLVRGHLAFATSHGTDATGLLLDAARRFQSLGSPMARDAFLEALLAGMFAGRLALGAGVVDVAGAAANLPRASSPGAADLLLEGMARLFTEGHAAARPILRDAIAGVRSPELTPEEQMHWLPVSCTASVELWDDESWYRDTGHYLDLVRESGALSELPFCINHRSVALAFAGELTAAGELVDEATVAVEASSTGIAPYAALAVAAWRGREAETRGLATACIADVTRRGEGNGLTVAHWAVALLYNGLGRYEAARAEAEQSSAFAVELSSSYWGLIELVEAAVRTGSPEQARAALDQLSGATQGVRSEWALGVEARSRALVMSSEDAYREATDRLARTRMRGELARAYLVYGEWLRREQRRTEAREELHVAVDMLNDLGIEAFGDRAVRELRETGERVGNQRRVDVPEALTPQELQVARCARDGLSNREIGARLFLSTRTVAWHLGHVYAKLGIASRRELQQGTFATPGGLSH